MFTPRSRIAGMTFAFLLFLIAGGIWYGSADFLRVQAAQPKDSKVKELLKERLATLKEIAVQIERAYKGRAMSIEQLQDANLAVLKAELDLCESDKERIAVLEKIVELAKTQEKQAVEAVKGGAVSGTTALKAKVSRLEAEIALERAKVK